MSQQCFSLTINQPAIILAITYQTSKIYHCIKSVDLVFPYTWVSRLAVHMGVAGLAGLPGWARCRQVRVVCVTDSTSRYYVAHRSMNPSVTLYYSLFGGRVSTGAKVRACAAASLLHGPRQEGLCNAWMQIFTMDHAKSTHILNAKLTYTVITSQTILF
jgi:hypothetical protein